MKTLLFSFQQLLVFLLVAASPVFSALGDELPTAKPADVGVSAKKLERITEFTNKLIAQQRIPGAVTVMARHGKVVYCHVAGSMDVEAGRPMCKDTIFRIASMTKPIASVAVIILHDNGELLLDDPLSKYIPEFSEVEVLVPANPPRTIPARREITIRDLLSHTAGFTYSTHETMGPLYREANLAQGLCQANIDLENNIKKLAKLPLLFSPGEQWEYGVSTDVLGRVVEEWCR